jgi:hypothetical protein
MSALFSLRNALFATAAALLGALGIETQWGAAFAAPIIHSPSVGTKHDTASVLPDFRLGSEATIYNQMVDRPLLNPSRKPAPVQIIVAAVPPEPPKALLRRGLYQLQGVTDLGTEKIAQVREIASNLVKSVRQGDQLQEFVVQKVEADVVTLAFAGEIDTLELRNFTASGRVPQPPVVAVASVAPLPSPPPAAAQSSVAGVAAAGGVAPTDVASLLERRRALRAQQVQSVGVNAPRPMQ